MVDALQYYSMIVVFSSFFRLVCSCADYSAAKRNQIHRVSFMVGGALPQELGVVILFYQEFHLLKQEEGGGLMIDGAFLRSSLPGFFIYCSLSPNFRVVSYNRGYLLGFFENNLYLKDFDWIL
jgi:hypothetical protein